MSKPVTERIRLKLTTLQPTRLDIHDDSGRHVGHAGARPEGESHFRVEIVSPVFVGQDRITRQRRVYALLADEIKAGLHALQLTTLTPDEEKGRAPSA